MSAENNLAIAKAFAASNAEIDRLTTELAAAQAQLAEARRDAERTRQKLRPF